MDMMEKFPTEYDLERIKERVIDSKDLLWFVLNTDTLPNREDKRVREVIKYLDEILSSFDGNILGKL